MIKINEEKSKKLCSYKLLNMNNVIVFRKEKIKVENEVGIDIAYLLTDNKNLYVFGGNFKKIKKYQDLEGFMTSREELTKYKNNLIDVLTENIKLNN